MLAEGRAALEEYVEPSTRTVKLIFPDIRGMAYLPLPVVRDMGNVERNTERWLMEFCLAGMRDEKKEAMNPPPDHTGTEDTSPGLTKPLSSMAVETDLASTAKADGADDESLAFLQFREAYRRLRARVEEQDRRLSSSILQPEEASSLAFKCLTSVANHVPQSHKEAWRSSLDDLTGTYRSLSSYPRLNADHYVEFQSILDEVGLVPRMKDVVSGNGKLQESLRSLAGRLPVILDQLDKVYSVKQATENGSLNTIIHALKIGFDEADEAALGFYKNSHEILTAYTTLQNLSSRLHSVTGVGQQGRNHQPPTEAGPSSQTPGKPGRLRRT